MTKTGTQNRPYTGNVMLVQATLTKANGRIHQFLFDWNDRNAVRCFAADSDACLRAGGKTLLEKLK